MEKYRLLNLEEEGLVSTMKSHAFKVALVYPNTYFQGMSNLGLHTVYALLNNRSDTVCERMFLPEPQDLAEHRRTDFPLVSIETQTPLDRFDLIAFSLSFENDYVNLPTLFELGKLPLFRKDREDQHPLILCGGVCAFMNPEPLAEIMDVFAVGEAEVLLEKFMSTWTENIDLEQTEQLRRLADIPGIYVPDLVDSANSVEPPPEPVANRPTGPRRVRRQWLKALDDGQARTHIFTPETEFSSMHLIEVSRGCPRACRFCAAGFVYRPFREHSLNHMKDELLGQKTLPPKIGLVAAAVSDYAALAELGQDILAKGSQVSVSSVRIDALTADQVKVLASSGHKTLALAPEAGSQRMRDVINKGIDESQILEAVRTVAREGIHNLKLYFMVGLPKETMEDILAIVDLVLKIREVWEVEAKKRRHMGRLQLSVNPFVPKPWTPLQWAPMQRRAELEKKYQHIRKELRTVPNVDLKFESLRLAEMQGLLARGDRNVGRILPYLAAGHNLRQACQKAGLDLDRYLYLERAADEIFPWDIIDQGFDRDYLFQEYQNALMARPGQICHPGCKRCGVVC